MIIDSSLEFSVAQALTTTAVSTNVIDTGAAHDEGIGEDTYINVKTNAALTGGTSLQIVVQTSTDNSTFTDVLQTPAILTAALTANTVIAQIELPRGLNRYVRLNYVIAGTYAAGTVSAALVKDAPRVPTYATSIVVL